MEALLFFFFPSAVESASSQTNYYSRLRWNLVAASTVSKNIAEVGQGYFWVFTKKEEVIFVSSKEEEDSISINQA